MTLARKGHKQVMMETGRKWMINGNETHGAGGGARGIDKEEERGEGWGGTRERAVRDEEEERRKNERQQGGGNGEGGGGAGR